MKMRERMAAAVAAFRGKGYTVARDVDLNRLLDFLGVTESRTGEALSEATYYACLKVLSETVGKLPLKIQQQEPGKGVRVAREHPWYRTLNERPNRYMTAGVFWAGMEFCRNHNGNAYAWIDTRDPQRPQLWPMDPGKVQLWYDDARRLSDAPDVYYQYSTPGGTVVLSSEEVLHLKSHHTRDGGLVGVSVRDQLSGTILGNVKAQKMTNDMYDSGMTAKAVLQYTGGLNDANVAALIEGVEAYAQGKNRADGVANIIPIPVGFTLTPLNMRLADSQFLEVKQYSALQIAAAFGVKPYQVGDYTKSSYASAEAQQLSFLVDTLLYIVKQYEEEIAYKLLTDDEEAAGYHVKFNTGVLLRADQRTQIETLSTAVNSFLLTPNEARERLDLPSVDGGDQLLGNGASIPVQYTGAQYTQLPGQGDTAPPAEEDTGEEDKAWKTTSLTK